MILPRLPRAAMLSFVTDAMLLQFVRKPEPTTIQSLPQNILVLVMQSTGFKHTNALMQTNKEMREHTRETVRKMGRESAKKIVRFMRWGRLFASTAVLYTRFQRLQLTDEGIHAIGFAGLVTKLRERKTIWGTKGFIMRVHHLSNPSGVLVPGHGETVSVNVRKVLSVMMMVYYTDQVFETIGDLEANALHSGRALIGVIDSVMAHFAEAGPSNRLRPELAAVFPRLLQQYIEVFDAWRGHDSAKLCARIERSLRMMRLELLNATATPDAQDNHNTAELLAQTNRLRQKLVQLSNQEHMDQFDATLEREIADGAEDRAANEERIAGIQAEGDYGMMTARTEGAILAMLGVQVVLMANNQDGTFRMFEATRQLQLLRTRLVVLNGQDHLTRFNAAVALMTEQQLIDAISTRNFPMVPMVLAEMQAVDIEAAEAALVVAAAETEAEETAAALAAVAAAEETAATLAAVAAALAEEVVAAAVEEASVPLTEAEIAHAALEKQGTEIEDGVAWRISLGGCHGLYAVPGDSPSIVRIKSEIGALRAKLAAICGPERLARMDMDIDLYVEAHYAAVASEFRASCT